MKLFSIVLSRFLVKNSMTSSSFTFMDSCPSRFMGIFVDDTFCAKFDLFNFCVRFSQEQKCIHDLDAPLLKASLTQNTVSRRHN